MALITTAAAGNWSSTGTWVGGVVPGNGDTVTLNHSVTVDVDSTIGTSGAAGTVVVTQASGVTVTVAAGKKLYVRGNYQLGGATNGATVFRLEAGAGYVFDGSVSNTAYKFVLGGRHYANPAPRFETAGTSSARCSVTSLGTAKGYFSTGAWAESAAFNCVFTDFIDIYDQSTKRFLADGFSMYNSGSEVGRKFIFNDCRFVNYGAILIDGAINTNIISVQRNNFSGYIDNANGTSALYLYGTNTDSGGNHTFKDCSVDGVVNILRGRSYGRVTGCVFQRRVKNTYENGLLGFNNNFSSQLFGNGIGLSDITNYDSGRVDLGVEINNNYFHQRKGSHVDVHVIQLGSGGGTIDAIGNIWEVGDNSVTSYTDEGAFLMVTGGSWTLNCKKNIALKDTAIPGQGSGRIIAALPATGSVGAHSFVINFDGNTGAYVSGPLIKTGEGYPGHSGMIGTLRNNLVNGRGDVLRGVLANHANGTKPAGILLPANVKNNNIYNAYTGTNGYGYDGYNAADQVGDSDISLDPMFFDSDRRLRTWDASLGGPGTDEHAIAELAKLNTPDHDSRYTVENLMAWVKAGFAPTNMALLTAGYDGGYIGAVQPDNTANIGWEVWTEPMLADKPQPTYNPAIKNTSISLSGAKNEWVGFLVCVRGNGTLSGFVPSMSVTLSNGSETIADANVIPYILYNHTTTERANAYEVPGVYPDAAVPYRDVYYNEVRDGVKAGWGQVFAENTTRVFFVEIYIPTATAHGAFTGTFRLTSNSGALTRDIPISLNVWNATLPEQWSLKNIWGVNGTNWVMDGAAFGGRNDVKAREYLYNLQKAAINHGVFLYGSTGRQVSGPTTSGSFTDPYFDGANDMYSWRRFLDGAVPQGYNPKPYPRTSIWCTRDESGGALINKTPAIMDAWKAWVDAHNYGNNTLFIDKILDEPTLAAINAKHGDHVIRHAGEPDRPMEYWTASSLAYPKDSEFWTDSFTSAWMISQFYTWYRSHDFGSPYGSPADFDDRIAQYGDLLFSYTAGDNDSACNIATYAASRGIRAAASSSLDAYSRQNAYMLISDWHFGTVGHHFWMVNQGWGYDVIQGVADASGNFSIPIPHVLANGTYQIKAYWTKGDGTTGLLSGAGTIVSSASSATSIALPLTGSTVGPNVTVTGSTTIPGVTVRVYISGTVPIDSANYVWSCTDPFGDYKMQNGYGGTEVQAYNGDGVYFYPGRVSGTDYDIGGTHDIPIESYKLKLVRWGAQVYEYCKLLESRGYKSIADAQIARMITFNTPNKITISPVQEWEDARLALGAQISAQLPADMAVGNNSSNNTYSSSGFLLGMRYDLISPMIKPYMSPIQTVLS